MRLHMLSVACICLVLAGCDPSGGASPPPTVAAQASATPVVVPPTPGPTGRRPCPNPDGGSGNHCLGPIEAGTYETDLFTPTLRYTVPAGWSNFEDMAGNFLLIPPGGSLAGIGDGSSDYIGVYSGVGIADDDCDEVEEEGVGQTAVAMAEELVGRPGLEVTEPRPVTIGGRSGLTIDIALDEDWDTPCPYSAGTPIVPLIIGLGPAALHHVQVQGAGTRFYFLDPDPTNIVFEVNDGPDQADPDAYESVIETFEFLASP